jgi:hypothetical protein
MYPILYTTLTVLALSFFSLLLWKNLGESRREMMKTTRELTTTVLRENREFHSDLARRTEQTILTVTADMTETAKKVVADQSHLAELLTLGRDYSEPSVVVSRPNGNEPSEPQPIPGLETLEGLPPNIREAIEREAQEMQNSQPVLSRKPPIDFGPRSEVVIEPIVRQGSSYAHPTGDQG